MFSVDTNTFSIRLTNTSLKNRGQTPPARAQAHALFVGQEPRQDFRSLTHNPTRFRWTIFRRPRAWPAHSRKPQRPGNSVQPPARQKPRKHALFSLRCRSAAFGLFGARASASLASRRTSVYLTVRLVPGNGRRLHANRYAALLRTDHRTFSLGL